MSIDQLSPLMQQYLDKMTATMLSYYKAESLNDWVQIPESRVASIEFSMGAQGKENDPYLELTPLEEEHSTEIRYDKKFTDGYEVKWSPKRGTFFVYKNEEYVQCHPTGY